MTRLKGNGCSITFHVKDFQAWHTKEDLMLLNGPMSVFMETYATEARNILATLEQRLVSQYPI